MLGRVESAKRADPILEQALTHRGLSRLDRAFITELVYGVLRQRGYLAWILSQRIQHPGRKPAPRLRNLLRSARTIAVVGASPKPERDSYRIAKYLLEA